MKLAVVMVLVALVAVAFVSGCVTEPIGPSGGLTADQMEEQAYQEVENELGNLEDMSLEEIENELLG